MQANTNTHIYTHIRTHYFTQSQITNNAGYSNGGANSRGEVAPASLLEWRVQVIHQATSKKNVHMHTHTQTEQHKHSNKPFTARQLHLLQYTVSPSTGCLTPEYPVLTYKVRMGDAAAWLASLDASLYALVTTTTWEWEAATMHAPIRFFRLTLMTWMEGGGQTWGGWKIHVQCWEEVS